MTGSDRFTQLFVWCRTTQVGSEYWLNVSLQAWLYSSESQSPEESFISLLLTNARAFDGNANADVEISFDGFSASAHTRFSRQPLPGIAPIEFRAHIDVDKWDWVSDTLAEFDVGDRYQVTVPCDLTVLEIPT